MQIRIDFDKTVGKIKPLHGIDNAPVMGIDTSLFHFMKEAGIPYCRFNDMGGMFGGGLFVDIINIFRDFTKDPEDPASYDFTFTDWLFEKVKEQGADIVYRLGPSIENWQHIKAYYIYPPEDNLKWAKICEHIIMHYNYGWADGYHYDIKYWEIWNEPDNGPDIESNQCWKGTMEQFFELYVTAASYLKEKFPHLKIGGYGSCGFYSLTGFYEKTANSSARTDYFVDFFKKFIDYITEHKAPLDFFTWHSYATVEHNTIWVDYVREYLDSHGFAHTESHLNEWNPGVRFRGTEEDAARVGEMLVAMHKKPIDVMNYYNGESRSPVYSGLFDKDEKTVFPAYWALNAFNELYVLQNEAHTECEVPVLAATDGKTGKIMVTNNTEEARNLELEISGNWKVKSFRINEGRTGLVDADISNLTIPAKKIAIIEFEI